MGRMLYVFQAEHVAVTEWCHGVNLKAESVMIMACMPDTVGWNKEMRLHV